MFRNFRWLYQDRKLMVFLSFTTLRQFALAEVSKSAKPKLFSRMHRKYKSTSTTGTFVSLKDLKEQWLKQLQKQNIPEAELSLRYILEHVLCSNGIDFKYVDEVELKLSKNEVEQINNLCQKRLQRMPTQYVIGQWDFRFLTLSLRPPVLIPRPETEELIDLVASHHCLDDGQPTGACDFVFLEIGCGSGAISLSLLSEYPQTSCVAIDPNPDAVELSWDNARRCGVQDRIILHCIDIESIQEINHSVKYDAIISNPPYIPERDMNELEEEIARYEDWQALCGGVDGMDIIKAILCQSKHLLKPNGYPHQWHVVFQCYNYPIYNHFKSRDSVQCFHYVLNVIWLEVDLTHPPLVEKWIDSRPHLELEYVKSHADFTGR